MRLGGKLTPAAPGAEAWIAAVQAKGYRAAYCPLPVGAPAATIADYRRAAADADIVIAEVGVWNNPLSPDPAEAKAAFTQCVASLELAEAIGAACCVNLAGTRNTSRVAPRADSYTQETFDLVVATTQRIIDAVQPQQTYYTLETMPWALPYSVDSYRRLMAAIDRPRLGVHFDPVNLISSPERYFGNADLIIEFVAAFGPAIRSVHVKDIILRESYTVHLDETRPGTGHLALDVLLAQLVGQDPDLPIMLEHLPNEEEYDAAAAHLRQVAQGLGLAL
jgi:sugar phosphate isomerase/epimerase